MRRGVDSDRPQTRSPGPAPVGSTSTLVAGAVVFAGLVVLAGLTLYRSAGPPDLDVVIVAVRPEPGGYHVVIVARNDGAHMAANVHVRGELHGAGATETAETTIPYVPGASTVWTSLHFRRDPRAALLTVDTTRDEAP